MNLLMIAVTIAALSMQVLSKETIEKDLADPANNKTTPKPTTTPKARTTITVKPKTTITVKPKTTITVKPKTTATTAQPKNATTTAQPKTTTAQPKTTTAQPKNATTTAQPKNATTTAQPKNVTTTAQPKNATTTAKPKNATTTAQPKNTTVAPTTKPATTTPDPTHLHFTVSDGNQTCMWLNGIISLNLTEQTSYKVHDLLQTGAIVSGKCSPMKRNQTSSISMVWGKRASVKITFIGGDPWFMSEIDVTLAAKSASAVYNIKSNGILFQAGANHSYTCANDDKLLLTGKGKYNITIDFKKVSIQPFHASKGFINVVACPSKVNPHPDSSIVPIAVGCALAGLIVIVLIAYLIGRRKGGNRGYQKV